MSSNVETTGPVQIPLTDEPATPPADQAVFFADVSDGKKPKMKDDDGQVTALGDVSQADLDAEAAARIAADNAEAAARAAADTALDGRVDALELAPPAHAASHTDGGSDEIAISGEQVTAGTIADARIALTIARDSDVTTAITASEAGQVRDGDAAGGVLAGTYPNPSFAENMATQAELDGHLTDAADAHDASAISFVPTGTIAATDVQAAIAEVAAETGGGGTVDSIVEGHGTDIDATDPANPIVLVDESELTVVADLAAHLADTTDAHDASAISIADAGNDFTASDVEGALAELQADHEADALALADHLADTIDAHDASAISILDTANDFTASDVEGALAELQADHETDAQNLADHIADTSAAHAASAISYLGGTGMAATDVEAAIDELATEKQNAADVALFAVKDADESYTRHGLRFIAGTDITIEIADDAGGDEVEVTITSTAVAGGGGANLATIYAFGG